MRTTFLFLALAITAGLGGTSRAQQAAADKPAADAPAEGDKATADKKKKKKKKADTPAEKKAKAAGADAAARAQAAEQPPTGEPMVAQGPMQPPGNPPTAAGGPPGGPTMDDMSSDADLYRCKNLPKRAKFKVTLKPETELKELVQWAMSFTCRNFIFGQGIMGRNSKVTIIAPTEMTPGEAWNLFLVSLQTMNLNVVPKGKTLEIVESQTAREKPLPIYKGGGAPDSDQIVRAILRPANITVDDLTQICNSLKSSNGTCTPVPNMGVLIVTDFGSSIDRMAEVMRMVDLPNDGEKIYIIPIRYADATELVGKLNEIFGARQGGGGGGQPPGGAPRPAPGTKMPSKGAPAAGPTDVDTSAAPSKIIADERTNSIIVIASDAAYARILALVKRLDTAVEGGEGRIHVYPLANADAEEMAGTLGGLISGQSTPTRGGAGGRPGAPAAPAAPQPGGSAASGTAAFEGQVKISFDKPSNSLIIVSSVKDYLSIRDVIRKLDQPRRQVFVEATIMEVNLDKTRRLGVSWHGGTLEDVDGHSALLVGGVQHDGLRSVAPASLATGTGGVGGALGEQIPESQTILGLSIPSVGLLFQVLQNNNDVNVISAPHIIAMDNEPAQMDIGNNIPIQSGPQLPSLGATGGAAGGAGAGLGLGLGSNVSRQKVGIKLQITPHLNESDMVRLEVELDVEDIISENFGGLGAAWSTRHAKTKAVVRDQEPVVIGGMMQEKETLIESKVPLLGDIPILGYLFKFETKKKQKTNLIIIMTPYIIRDNGDLRRIFDKKMRERKEFIRTYTAFSETEWKSDVDYGRKTGLIEDINHTVRVTDEDEQLRREAEASQIRQENAGPVEMPAMGNPPPGGSTPNPTPPPPPPGGEDR